MGSPSYVQVTVAPALVPLVCLIGAVVSTALARRRRGDVDAVAVWVRWWFYGAMGVGGLVTFLSYLFAPAFMSGVLAFGYSLPFEHEVGAANLGFAMAAVMSVRLSADARVTAASGYLVFLYLAAFWHLYELVVHGDTAPGNTVGILVADLVVPAVALGLALRQRHEGRDRRPADAV